MPSFGVDVMCEYGHLLYLAAYRNSKTIKRIPGLYYCPECNEFYKVKSEKIKVAIR